MIGFGSSYTNGELETITYNGEEKSYKKIFYLDNKMKLAEIYKILHDKENYNKDVAFILNSDLDFSKKKKAGGLDYVSLNNNLNLTDYETGQDTFLPIGGLYNYYNDNNINSAGGKDIFNASFYGNNHKIIVGDINYASNNSVGFFGDIGSDGKVYDLQLKIGNVNGNDYIGGFVGGNNGTIENSSAVVNSVKGSKYYIGGFAGKNYNAGTIENSSAVVNSVKGSKYYIGGFVGDNAGTIKNSSAVVNSASGSEYSVGGFVGGNNGTIENSSAVVNSVSGDYDIGGFAGRNNDGTIENSSAVVNSVSGDYDIGGFVGNNDSTISNSSAVVNSVSGDGYIGGFVGDAEGTIENSVARVLVLNSVSSNVSAGYYTNKNLDGNLININKKEFFFGNNLNNSGNKGFSYDWTNDGTNLTITVPTRKIFNKENFPSVFKEGNGTNWGNTIMTNLKNYWTKWEK